MIVSHKRNFAFVHIFKTAGTSVKRAIRRYAMPAWQEGANFVFKRIGVSQFGPRSHGDHVHVSDLIAEIGDKKFQRLFSFAFVRNPWDWELSHYRYICKNKAHESHAQVSSLSGFKDYLRWRCDGRFQTQQSFLLHQGNIAVDFVGRFENIQSDFRHVCRTLGIRYKLPRLNVTQKADFRSSYDEQTVELIAQTYAPDIERFGYSFEWR